MQKPGNLDQGVQASLIFQMLGTREDDVVFNVCGSHLHVKHDDD